MKKNFVFHVRDWNIGFFQELEKTLKAEFNDVGLRWLTMKKSAYNELKVKHQHVYYLPDLFKQTKLKEESIFLDFDSYLFKNHGYGIQYLYETERFKPQNTNPDEFIKTHFQVLFDIILNNSTTIALSCDHFVYILSSYITRFKNGESYFIQPAGFPLKAQVIMKNPWESFPFRNKALGYDTLNDYIESLGLDPMQTIHYMRPRKMVSLSSSLFIRIEKILRHRPQKSDYNYLDSLRTNIIPGRFTAHKTINYKFDYFDIDIWQEKSGQQKIFYFPLQLEPEMSILAYSPWYKDQLEVVRLVSQSLKTGDLLLLKENPKMIGKRDVSFYKQVNKYNNVVWAHPGKNSREIIKRSFKVLSITGTATIEAACLGVNSLLFGYPPFRSLIIEKPVAEQPLSNMTEALYRYYKPEDILQHVIESWSGFSKFVLFGNYTPRYINNTLTLARTKELASGFFNEVIQKTQKNVSSQ